MISFIFTKIIQYFILPPGIFTLLLPLLKGFKKAIVILVITLYLLSTQFVAFKLLEPLESPYRTTQYKSFDAIALLGGGYIAKSKNLGLSSDSFKRYIYAIEIAKEQNIPIIFDGSKEEALEIKRVTLELNSKLKINMPILEESYQKKFGIYIQNRALTTIDNAKNIKEFLNKIKNIKLALVTSAYHMKRSLDEFKRVGLSPTPMATDFKVSQDNYFLYYLPTAKGLYLSSTALHEYLGLLRNFIFR